MSDLLPKPQCQEVVTKASISTETLMWKNNQLLVLLTLTYVHFKYILGNRENKHGVNFFI